MVYLPVLLLSAAPAASTPIRAQTIMRASVEIVRAERIEVREPKLSRSKMPTDRQYRKRDTMPMVEFF